MSKFKTAAQLQILPEERKALIDFVAAPVLGRTIAINGRAHYYDQSTVDEPEKAEENHCGTAGCVAGFVFAHTRTVQRKRRLRGANNADDYINAATNSDYDYETNRDTYTAPLLANLYGDGNDRTLPEAKRVVEKMLRTGKVEWR